MNRWLVHLAALASMIFWGLSYIWSKMAFEDFSPLTTIFFRLIISFVVLFVLLASTGKVEKVKKQDRLFFALTALFNPFLYFVGENYGLSYASASVSAIIVATIPLFSPLVAWVTYREKLRPANIVGLLISFLGLILVVFNENFDLEINFWGLLLLFMAVFSALFYLVYLKKLDKKYSPATIVAYQNLLGVVYFLPLFLIFDMSDVAASSPNLNSLWALLLLGVFSSSLAYVLYVYVVKNIGIIKSSLYTNLIPVFTILFSVLLLDESISTRRLIGMAVVIFGLILSESGKTESVKTAA